VLLDVSPLRDFPSYRLMWLGQSVNVIGNQVTRVALPYQVYVLTHSTLAIAGLTIAQLVPLLLFSLAGGSLADAVDRRRLLIVTQIGLASTSAALVLVSIGGAATRLPPVRDRRDCRVLPGCSTPRRVLRPCRVSCHRSGCRRPSRSAS